MRNNILTPLALVIGRDYSTGTVEGWFIALRVRGAPAGRPRRPTA